jgi:hypothetical protein
MNAAAIYSLNHRIEEQVVSSSQKSPTLQTISHPTTQFKFEFSKDREEIVKQGLEKKKKTTCKILHLHRGAGGGTWKGDLQEEGDLLVERGGRSKGGEGVRRCKGREEKGRVTSMGGRMRGYPFVAYSTNRSHHRSSGFG